VKALKPINLKVVAKPVVEKPVVAKPVEAKPQLVVQKTPKKYNGNLNYSKWENLADSDDEAGSCSVGDRVEATWADGQLKGATIAAVNGDNTITVNWGDGNTSNRKVPAALVFKNGQACGKEDAQSKSFLAGFEEVDESFSRWSGSGLTIMEDLKKLGRKSQQEIKNEVQMPQDGAQLIAKDVEKTNQKMPKDHKKRVGVITAKELAKYDASNDRKLVSLYGDIFDVSSRPDQYGNGTYSWRSGRDITWSVITGLDNRDNCNRYYDIFKLGKEHMARFLQLLSQNLVLLEDEFGAPVGKLSEYAQDTVLPAPPTSEVPESCNQQ